MAQIRLLRTSARKVPGLSLKALGCITCMVSGFSLKTLGWIAALLSEVSSSSARFDIEQRLNRVVIM